MKEKFVLLLFLMMAPLKAEPEKITVFFLSQVKLGANFEINWSAPLASNQEFDCVETDGGCFHPQLGFIADGSKEYQEREKKVEVKTINSETTDLIKCEKGNHFDLFCGKAAKIQPANADVEVWIDTSSSMRKVDWGKDPNYCERRRFIAKLQNSCKKNLAISVFDTGKKSLGDLGSLCVNYGLNDSDRIVQWIKRSKAKHLYLVTDVEEYNGPLREYLDLVSAKIVGIGRKTTVASELYSYIGKISRNCR